ncbi:MAG: 50S ribosomal protein L3 [Magnetovibrio sp.]|nr:50S ribosomal protein L3 [Magnetovibrio sp.]
MPGILGKKIGMTRIFSEDGASVPLTVIECEPNTVTQVKTVEKDGYNAIVLGFGERKNPTKNKKFYFKREFRVENVEDFKVGDKITVEALQDIEKVNFTASSKGKGFQGVIKRHNFSRGPETHGSHHHRKPGSIGACAMPGRVAKGKKLPGRTGNKTVSYKNVPVAYLDTEKNLIGLKGPVPGAKNNLVAISF